MSGMIVSSSTFEVDEDVEQGRASQLDDEAGREEDKPEGWALDAAGRAGEEQ